MDGEPEEIFDLARRETLHRAMTEHWAREGHWTKEEGYDEINEFHRRILKETKLKTVGSYKTLDRFLKQESGHEKTNVKSLQAYSLFFVIQEQKKLKQPPAADMLANLGDTLSTVFKSRPFELTGSFKVTASTYDGIFSATPCGRYCKIIEKAERNGLAYEGIMVMSGSSFLVVLYAHRYFFPRTYILTKGTSPVLFTGHGCSEGIETGEMMFQVEISEGF